MVRVTLIWYYKKVTNIHFMSNTIHLYYIVIIDQIVLKKEAKLRELPVRNQSSLLLRKKQREAVCVLLFFFLCMRNRSRDQLILITLRLN